MRPIEPYMKEQKIPSHFISGVIFVVSLITTFYNMWEYTDISSRISVLVTAISFTMFAIDKFNYRLGQMRRPLLDSFEEMQDYLIDINTDICTLVKMQETNVRIQNQLAEKLVMEIEEHRADNTRIKNRRCDDPK